MDSVIVFGPDKEDPLDDDLDLPEADIKDRIAWLPGESDQLGVILIRNFKKLMFVF